MNVKELENYKIVIRSDSGECEKYSAETLKKYLEKTCGVNLKIVFDDNNVVAPFFSIGETAFFNKETINYDRNETVSDGFKIFKTEDGNVFFDSITARGVMYAVYDFIENELGVKFLTAKAEVVNSLKTVDFSNIDRLVKPEFEMMTYCTGDVFDTRFNKADLDHYARTRTKDVYTDIPEKIGGPLKIYGRNVSHNFHFYVPFSKYGIKHYDWYHFFDCNNEVVPAPDITNGITEDGKVDETMEESVVKIVIEEMKKDIDKYPDVEIFMLTQEDTSYFDDDNNRRLEKKYKRSGILIRFINVVARAMDEYCKEKYPGRKVRLMTFAYSYAVDAPVKTENGKIVPIDETVVAADNVIIQLALFNHGSKYFGDCKKPSTQKAINEWGVIAKAFWFWMYDINFHRFNYFYDSLYNAETNVRGWKKMGIKYLFCDTGQTYGVWLMNIKAYVYRKLSQDVNRSQEKYINEFIDLYYGAAAKQVHEVLDLYHNRYQQLDAEGKVVYFDDWSSSENPENIPLSLHYKVKDIILDGEKAVNEANISDAEKKEYLRRLAGVMMTPLIMINDRYYDYFPNASEKDRIASNAELKEWYYRCEEPRMDVGSITSMEFYFGELDEAGAKHELEKH